MFYDVHISTHRVPAAMWKNVKTGQYNRDCIQRTIKKIFLENVECPCQLRFYNLMENKKVAGSIVAYAICSRRDLHTQYFKFEINDFSKHEENDKVKL